MLGETVADLGLDRRHHVVPYFGVKAVAPFEKFGGRSRPRAREMRSKLGRY